MMNFWALGLLLLSSNLAQALTPPSVVLVTSLDPKAGKSFFDGSDWNGNLVLEKIFRKRFENSGYQIEVYHQADAQTLWNVLHSSNTAGVFFVGHAADEGSLGNGLESEGIIADISGNNLINIFTAVHPNIRFLAIVGCDARAIFDSFETRGFYKNNPSLQIFSFDHEVDPYDFPIELSWNSGLTQAINASLPKLAKNQTYDELFPDGGACEESLSPDDDDFEMNTCEQYYVTHRNIVMSAELAQGMPQACYLAQGYKINVTRKLTSENSGAPLLELLSDGKVIGVLPALNTSSTQQATVYLELPAGFTAEDMKITADSGLSLENAGSVVLGRLNIEGWSPIADPQGNPLGVTENIYRYSGALPGTSALEEYSPYACDSLNN
jgi:hypothetical protein